MGSSVLIHQASEMSRKTVELCMNMHENNTEGINRLCSDVSAILIDAAKLSG